MLSSGIEFGETVLSSIIRMMMTQKRLNVDEYNNFILQGYNFA